MGEFKSVFGMEFRHMLRRSQTRFAMTFMLLIVIISFLENCFAYMGVDVTSTISAATAFMGQVGGSNLTAMLFYNFFIFFIGCMMFSDNFFTERNNKLINSIVTRSSKSRYLIANATVSFIGAFLVIFIGLIISQLLSLAVFPTESTVAMKNLATYHPLSEDLGGVFPGLLFNSPYLVNIIFSLYAAVWAGIMGLLSFVVSLC